MKYLGTQASAQDVATVGPALGSLVEVNLGATPRRGGSFNLTGAGLTVGAQVRLSQAKAAYTGKGTRTDECEMDAVTAAGVVTGATAIHCSWASPTRVRGNCKFIVQGV